MDELIPIVDLAQPEAPARIDAACSSVGFMSITNHGVAPSVVEAMVAATDAFFALPLEEKVRLRSPRAEINRGYAAKGTEGLTYSLGVAGRPPDLFEAFNVGPDRIPDGIPPDRPEFAANIWPERPERPERPEGLRAALVAYFDAVSTLARRLTSLMAIALGLDEEFFADKTDHSTETLRVIRYSRDADEPNPAPDQQRMGAHTDYGILTILHADRVPGLEIVGPNGAWHGVMPPDGAFLVNLGDLLAEWTNDRWRSTLHRVVPPPGSDAGPAVRRSMAFFHDGNYDARIECLPTCCSDTDPPRYPPVVAGEHLRAKLLGPRTLTASDAISTAGARVNAVIRGV